MKKEGSYNQNLKGGHYFLWWLFNNQIIREIQANLLVTWHKKAPVKGRERT